MERGRTFYLALANGLVSLVLLLTAVNLPAQLVFESKPYAFVVLTSGNLDGWTAEQLGLTPVQFNMVKNNYGEFLSRHPTADDSDSEDSDSSEDTDYEVIKHVNDEGRKFDRVKGKGDRDEDKIVDKDKYTHHSDNNNDDVNDDDDDDDNDHDGKKRRKRDDMEEQDDNDVADDGDDNDEVEKSRLDASNGESDSSSSSDEDSSEDTSDSDELTLEQKLKDKPFKRTIGLGLFHASMCSVLKKLQERCVTVSVNEAIFILKQEVPFAENDINMPIWNNLRVESLFSVITCVVGMVCLFASLKPCCDNKRLPVYLGSISFFTTGVLVLIPIVRLLLVYSDFEQSIATSLNVTTKLMTSWSLIASGIGAVFALIASLTLIATKWIRITKKWYHVMKSHPADPEFVLNGNATEIKMTDRERREIQPVKSEVKNDIYQNTEEKRDLLSEDGKELDQMRRA